MKYKRVRQNCCEEHKRHIWADWLKEQALRGPLAALRAREAAQGLTGTTVEDQATPRHAPVVDNITKQGTIIFRAGTTAVRDDGDKLQVSRKASPAGLQHALRLAMAQYGNCISVNGSVEFKAHIIRAAVNSQLSVTFADPALESRRQALLKEKSDGEFLGQGKG